MPSKDTILTRITKNTANEIERWKKKIAETFSLDVDMVSNKQAEISMRECAKAGSLSKRKLEDILLGKIK